MAGHRPWRMLRETLHASSATRSTAADRVTAWVATRRDPAFVARAAREARAAVLLEGALDRVAYQAVRRAVRDALGLDPDAVPHDPPADWRPEP